MPLLTSVPKYRAIRTGGEMKTGVKPWVWFLVVLSIQPAALLYGQTARGQITGLISDSSGAVLPGVTVRATNLATNVSFDAATNGQGRYTLDLLPPGDYRVNASKEGFKSVERSLIVHADDHIGLDVTLEVGAISERVLVKGEAPLLQTADSA